MKRIEYLDATKGFAIFLMVFAHVIAWQFEDYSQVVLLNANQDSNIKVAGFLWQLVYSFHMPLFFLISGVFSDSKGSLSMKCIRKSRHLLIPYFTTGFFILLVRPTFGYWFLFTLWQLQIISIFLSWILQKINKQNSLVLDVSIIVVVYGGFYYFFTRHSLTNPLCDLKKFVDYFIPFFFGYLLKKHNSIKEFIEGKYVFFLVLFVFMFSCRYIEAGGGNTLVPICNFLNRFSVTSILGSLFVMEYFRLGVNKRVESFLGYLGRNTLYIYVFPYLFVSNMSLPVLFG